jgi:membrane protein DedA with SNARE-associated domain
MNILNSLLAYVLLYRYWTIAAVVYSAAVILPLPSNAMLLAVGAFASQGYFNFWGVLATAVIANVAGDLTDYGITRHWGDRVVRLLHLHKFKLYSQLQEELRTDAAITVFMTRFAGSLSPIAALLAGLVGVPFNTFLINDFLGNLIEPFVALGIGYVVGNYWDSFSNLLELIAAIVAVAIIMFVLFRIYRRMMRKYEGE